MQTYKISQKSYYLADDLKNKYPKIFKGSNTTRIFLKKSKILEDNYLFARKTGSKWKESDGTSYKFDKIFIKQKWFDNKYNISERLKYEDDVQDAPDVIELEDEEKFFDNENNIEIEVRGERDVNNCYFKVKDLMDGFGLKNLHKTIIDKRKQGYKLLTHYKYFYINVYAKDENKKVKKLFLTYKGLLRVLFASNKTTADKFIDWASKVLFTAQMGTSEQKTELVGNILGVSTESVKSVFNKTVNKVPCVYLYSIGKVEDLRESLDIDDTYNDKDYVYKWGMSNDLERRTKEHEKSYGALEGSKLELVLFGYIDPQYISEAETRLSHSLHGMEVVLEHETHVELAIIPKNKMKVVREQYDMISQMYMGHIKDLITKIKEKDNEIASLKKDNEITKKDNEIAMLKKDLEIANIKSKMGAKKEKS